MGRNWMNVAVHEKEKKNEKAREQKKKRQTTDFRVRACCSTAVVQRGSTAKKTFGSGRTWGMTNGRVVSASFSLHAVRKRQV